MTITEPMTETTITLAASRQGMDDCDAATLVGILMEALIALPFDHRAQDFLARTGLIATVNATMADPYVSYIA